MTIVSVDSRVMAPASKRQAGNADTRCSSRSLGASTKYTFRCDKLFKDDYCIFYDDTTYARMGQGKSLLNVRRWQQTGVFDSGNINFTEVEVAHRHREQSSAMMHARSYY